MNTFLAEYNNTKNVFEKHLNEYTNTFSYYREISVAIKYSLKAGGKRLRPVLMIETAKMLGLDVNRIMPLAVAIEMIHTYSLIHDDLPCMDDDVMRRGQKTNHIVFGEAQAILAGDGLLNLAMEHALKSIEPDNYANYLKAISQLFTSSGVEGMIAGQSMDIYNTGKFQTLEELKTMHHLKTGALFLSSCLCPALILDCNNDIISYLMEYSSHFGLLFQITDDILDVTGDESALGKSIGKDTANSKSTFVGLLGIDKSIESANTLATKAHSALNMFGNKANFLNGLIDYVLERNK